MSVDHLVPMELQSGLMALLYGDLFETKHGGSSVVVDVDVAFYNTGSDAYCSHQHHHHLEHQSHKGLN